MDMNWKDFEKRWEDIYKEIDLLNKIQKSLSLFQIEFGLQQLLDAKQYIGLSVHELEKLCSFENRCLRNQIGPYGPEYQDEEVSEEIVSEVDINAKETEENETTTKETGSSNEGSVQE